MNLAILNGPNLQALGWREPHLYGCRNMQDILTDVRHSFPEQEIDYFQSNHEGALLDKLYEWESNGCQGVVLNAGAYTHTGLALADCLRSIRLPVVEVHLTNILAREDIRRQSLISEAAIGIISGFGAEVYRMGIGALITHLQNPLSK